MKYVTIHHIESIDRHLHDELRYGERDQPNLVEFEREYEPAETILGTDDVDEAFHRAQGGVVNRQQNGRHMVHSAMPTDVFEVHTDDPADPVAFFMVKPVGFERINWPGAELPRGTEVRA